nr:DUF4923 family protein [uncultured Ruminococcus sp.]
MKKNISIKGLVLLLALCLVGSFAMYGCGSDDKSSSKADSSASDTADKTSDDSKNSDDDTQVADITGEWVLDAIIDSEGNSQTLEEYCANKGVDSSGVDVTYTFSEDGTLVGAVGGVGVEGTYEFDGEQVACTISGTTSNFDYNADDDTISYSDENTGLSSVLVRK